MGLPAIVIDATHVATKLKTGFRNKTDRDDARVGGRAYGRRFLTRAAAATRQSYLAREPLSPACH
jgi:hypothetical protein